jgi:hypothetical protein
MTILTLAGYKIEPRVDDYVPMSFLDAGGKTYKDLMKDFSRNGRLSQLLKAEAAKMSMVTVAKSDDFSTKGLIEVNTKTNKHFRGFLHPRAALVIAMYWFPPKFSTQVAEWVHRFVSGDLTLVSDIISTADTCRGTISFATITSTTNNGAVTTETLQTAHNACSAAMNGSKRSRDTTTACMTSTVTKCARTQNIIVNSDFVEQTGLVDWQWGAIADVPSSCGLDDCRIVYFIRRGGTPEVKVGFSYNPVARLYQLQCGNAFDLRIEHQVPTLHYRVLERWLHDHLKSKGLHLRGEWFDLAAGTDYGAIVDEAIRVHGGLPT